MAAPTLVATYSSSYTTSTSPKTVSVTTQAGDTVIVFAMTNSAGVIPNTPTGNSIVFSLVADNNGGAENGTAVWYGTDSTGGTNWTLSCSVGSNPWGFTCMVYRNVASVQLSTAFEKTGAPHDLCENFTTKTDMLVLINDSNGIGTGFGWKTVEGNTPSSGNGGELVNAGTASSHGFHAARYPSLSAIDQYDYGLDTETSTNCYIAGIQIEGAVTGTPLTFRSTSVVSGTGSDPTGTEPTGTLQGDLLVAFYVADNATESINLTPPSGWRSIEGGTSITSNQFVYNICYTIRGASAPSYVFSQEGISVYRELHIFSFYNANSTWPIDGTFPGTSYVSTLNGIAAGSVSYFTPQSDGTTALCFGVCWSGPTATAYNATGAYIMRSTTGSSIRAAVSQSDLGNVQLEGMPGFSQASTTSSDRWAGVVTFNRSNVSRPSAGPLHIGEYESAWHSTSTSKTVPITISSTSDVLVVCGTTGDGSSTTLSAPTGGSGITWTLEQSYTTGTYCGAYVWTATNISPQSFTLTMAASGTETNGFNVLQFANAVVGASTKQFSSSGTPSVSLTTTSNNSAIVAFINDHAGADGSTRTWVTTAGSVIEKTYRRVAGDESTYVGIYPSVGAAGSKTVGLSAPTSQKYTMIALEIQGAAGNSAPIGWIVG